jgi:hypothetical protein
VDAQRALTDSARRHSDRNTRLLVATVEKEEKEEKEKEESPLSEGIQRGCYSDAGAGMTYVSSAAFATNGARQNRSRR